MALDRWDLEIAEQISNCSPAERSIRVLNARIESLKKELREAEFVRDTMEHMRKK